MENMENVNQEKESKKTEREKIISQLDVACDALNLEKMTQGEIKEIEKEFGKGSIDWTLKAVQNAKKKSIEQKKDAYTVQVGENKQEEGIPVDQLILQLGFLADLKTNEIKVLEEKIEKKKNEIEKLEKEIEKEKNKVEKEKKETEKEKNESIKKNLDKKKNDLTEGLNKINEARKVLKENSVGYFDKRPEMKGDTQHWRTTYEAYLINQDYRHQDSEEDNYKKAMEIMSQRRELIFDAKSKPTPTPEVKTATAEKAPESKKEKKLIDPDQLHDVCFGASLRMNKQGEIEINKSSTLDSKIVHGLLDILEKDKEIKLGKIEYRAHNNPKSGAINIGLGELKGLNVIKEKYTGETIYFNSKESENGQELPACKMVYETFFHDKKIEKEKKEAIERIIQFVSDLNNRNLPPVNKKLWEKSDKTVLGLYRFMNFDNLVNYFSKTDNYMRELSQEEIEKYKLNNPLFEQQIIEQQENIKQNKGLIKEFKEDGFVVKTKFGEIIVDIGGRMKGGYVFAKSNGYAGYLLYKPEINNIYLTLTKENFPKDFELSEGFKQRDSIWIREMSEDKMKLTLDEILNELGGGISERKGKLEEFCLKEISSTSKKEVKKEEIKNAVRPAVTPKVEKPEPLFAIKEQPQDIEIIEEDLELTPVEELLNTEIGQPLDKRIREERNLEEWTGKEINDETLMEIYEAIEEERPILVQDKKISTADLVKLWKEHSTELLFLEKLNLIELKMDTSILKEAEKEYQHTGKYKEGEIIMVKRMPLIVNKKIIVRPLIVVEK